MLTFSVGDRIEATFIYITFSILLFQFSLNTALPYYIKLAAIFRASASVAT